MSNKTPTLSIITATFNAGKYLPTLVQSLRSQSNKNFNWIVADGNSTDNTLKLLHEIKDIKLTVLAEKDFGIYDALNRAIYASTSDYYLVVGADDTLNPNVVSVIMKYLTSQPNIDVLIGQVLSKGRLIKIQKGKKFLYGARALVASHSVGTVFKKNLHDKFGMYTNKYPLFADTYFIKQIFTDKELSALYVPEVFGHFSDEGMSSNNILRAQCEFAHIQLTTEKYKFIQLLLIFLRLTLSVLKKRK